MIIKYLKQFEILLHHQYHLLSFQRNLRIISGLNRNRIIDRYHYQIQQQQHVQIQKSTHQEN